MVKLLSIICLFLKTSSIPVNFFLTHPVCCKILAHTSVPGPAFSGTHGIIWQELWTQFISTFNSTPIFCKNESSDSCQISEPGYIGVSLLFYLGISPLPSTPNYPITFVSTTYQLFPLVSQPHLKNSHLTTESSLVHFFETLKYCIIFYTVSIHY